MGSCATKETKQVSGHKGILFCNDKIYKPFQNNNRGVQESNFYNQISKSKDLTDINLKNLMPYFHGIHKDGTKKYICLENLVSKYSKPCILDLKIGSRTSSLKINSNNIFTAILNQFKEKYLYKLAINLGYSFDGMKIYSPDEKRYTTYSKLDLIKQGKSLSYKGFIKFFNDGKIDKRIPLQIEKKLQEILNFFKKQKRYKFYSSSILIIYEGDPKLQKKNNVTVKMIDFANVYLVNNKLDLEYIKGLQNCIKVLQKTMKPNIKHSKMKI